MAFFRNLVAIASAALLIGVTADGGPVAVSPSLIPAGSSSVTVTVELLPKTLMTYNFKVNNGASAAAVGSAGKVALAVPATTGIVTIESDPAGSGRPADPVRTFAVQVYTVPTFSTPIATGLSTRGLTTVAIPLATGALPSTVVAVNVRCRAAGATITNSLDSTTILTDPTAFAYETNVKVVDVAGLQTLTFTSKAEPRDTQSCPFVDVYFTFNGGAVYHHAGRIPVLDKAPVKVTSLYPSDLEIRWVRSHNTARIAMAAAYQTAVDTSTYYVNAWLPDPLPDGTELSTQFFKKGIDDDKTELFLCAGGEFKPTGNFTAYKYPSVNVLIMSTLRNKLSNYDNLATATGRMYEALYHAGFVGASVSKTGRLGFILALDHPTSYAFVSAFYLGAKAAFDAGLLVTAAGVPVEPVVYSWIIGDFNVPWNEKQAALDLLKGGSGRGGVDMLMTSTDNAVLIQAEAHAQGAFTVGFNANDRETLGDKVLVSALYNWDTIYLEFVRRMIAGEKFGGTFYDGGMGFGVSLTGLSPLVPLRAASMLQQRIAISSVEDTLEEVFCAPATGPNMVLKDAAGMEMLRGDTGVVASGMKSAVRGQNGLWCIHLDDVHTLSWVVQGVVLMGEFVPPPQPVEPTWTISSGLRGGIAVLPALILVFAAGSAAMLLIFRREAIIRSSSPLFLLVCLSGAVMYGATLLSLPGAAITDASCAGQTWSYGIAFALLFGSLFAKTHRVNRLFNNQNLRRLRLTTAYVIQLIAAVLAGEIIILLIIQFVFPPTAITERIVNSAGEGTIFHRCGAGGRYAAVAEGGTILSACHFSLLLWGVYLAFRTRNVPDVFNESRFIGIAIYNVTVCELIGFIVSPSPAQPHTASIMRLGVAPLATLILLFAPKAYAVWKKLVPEGDSTESSSSLHGQVAPMMGHGMARGQGGIDPNVVSIDSTAIGSQRVLGAGTAGALTGPSQAKVTLRAGAGNANGASSSIGAPPPDFASQYATLTAGMEVTSGDGMGTQGMVRTVN